MTCTASREATARKIGAKRPPKAASQAVASLAFCGIVVAPGTDKTDHGLLRSESFVTREL